MDAGLQKYYRMLLSKKSVSWAQEGQEKIQEYQTNAGRSGATGTGIYMMGLLGIHLEYCVRRPIVGPLETFDEACNALSFDASESDLDEILKEVEGDFDRRVSIGHQFVNDYIIPRGAPGDWATQVVNSARSALAQVRTDIELKKLVVRNRKQHNSGSNRIFISCGQVSAEEVTLGKEIERLVNSLPGFQGYFAQSQNSASGVTEHILKALHESSALICVMHRRGEVSGNDGKAFHRGSVWIEQEIAIVAFMEQVLNQPIAVRLYCQRGIELEGLRQQIIVHAVSFETPEDVLVDLRRWLSKLDNTSTPQATSFPLEEEHRLIEEGIREYPRLGSPKPFLDRYPRIPPPVKRRMHNLILRGGRAAHGKKSVDTPEEKLKTLYPD